jgi:phosphotransferase system  glucose/maltose/N-acetylglucosamine-specific IIC component
MGLGELLDAAFKLLRADFGPILLAAGAIIVPIQILTLVLTANVSNDLLASVEQNPQAFDDILGGAAAALPGIGVVTIISFVLSLIVEGAVVRIGAARYLGGAESAGDALKAAGRRFWRLLGVRILTAVLAVLPFLLLIGVAVAAAAASSGRGAAVGLAVGLAVLSLFGSLYLFIRWYLVSPAIMLEDAGVWASMRRSAQLVRGSWWRVLGYVIVAGIILAIVSTAVSGIFSAVGGAFPADWFGWVFTGIGAILAALVTQPVSALVVLMLYADLRVRKEGLDLQLRAGQAGTYPGAGSAQFSPGASPG